jgi:hypothetical protein
MTREELIRMAREAGIRDCTCNGEFGCLERFAALVAAAEREACAALADKLEWADNKGVASAIRARGQA